MKVENNPGRVPGDIKGDLAGAAPSGIEAKTIFPSSTALLAEMFKLLDGDPLLSKGRSVTRWSATEQVRPVSLPLDRSQITNLIYVRTTCIRLKAFDFACSIGGNRRTAKRRAPGRGLHPLPTRTRSLP